MLAKSLKNDPQTIARGNAACREFITQVAGGELVVRAAIGAVNRDACQWLISFEGDLARRGNQMKRSCGCLCGSGRRESAEYDKCKKTHGLTVHGPSGLKEECG
jgi:hypothetical protein